MRLCIMCDMGLIGVDISTKVHKFRRRRVTGIWHPVVSRSHQESLANIQCQRGLKGVLQLEVFDSAANQPLDRNRDDSSFVGAWFRRGYGRTLCDSSEYPLMILMMTRIDEEDMDAHAQACNGRREVAWSKELPGAWIEFEESTALELLVVFGQV
jgi:hypothetical protein